MKTDKLKKQLFESALHILESQGVEALNARKLAQHSSCALGSIYNAFGDLDDLKLHLNGAIISRLYQELFKTAERGIGEGIPLIALFKQFGIAYVQFATQNPLLWKAVFEHALPTTPLPDWYTKRAQDGINLLCYKLYESYGISEEKARRLVGFFWSSIHGMTSIILNRKMEMVSSLFTKDYLDDFIEYSLSGLFESRFDEMRQPTKT